MTEQQVPDTLRCEVCGQNVYAEEGKDPQAVLRGHQIRCKMLHRQQKEAELKEEEAAMNAQEEAPKEEPKEGKRQDTPKRKERIPFGSPTPKLVGTGDPAYVERYFNDNWRKDPDRVRRAQQAGYEIVQGRDPVTVGTNEDGTPIRGVLMRIPKEWYEEDQKAKQKPLDEIDAQIHRGKYQESAGDRRYVPSGGIKIETKLTP